jgi:hypothetical protein
MARENIALNSPFVEKQFVGPKLFSAQRGQREVHWRSRRFGHIGGNA